MNTCSETWGAAAVSCLLCAGVARCEACRDSAALSVLLPPPLCLSVPGLFLSLFLCLFVFLQELMSRLRQDQKAHPKALQQLEKQRQGLEKKLDGAARREVGLQRDNEALQVRRVLVVTVRGRKWTLQG